MAKQIAINTDRVGAAVIISMLAGALKQFVCPECYCLVSNRKGHQTYSHPRKL